MELVLAQGVSVSGLNLSGELASVGRLHDIQRGGQNNLTRMVTFVFLTPLRAFIG